MRNGICFKKNQKPFADIFHASYIASRCASKLKCITIGVDEFTDPFGENKQGISSTGVDVLKQTADNVVFKRYEALSGWFDP